jgi:hypothetical protein
MSVWLINGFMKRSRYVCVGSVVLLMLTLSGCWYRQCPIKGCMVRHEHSHGDRIVRGRGTFPRIHFMAPRTISAKSARSNNKKNTGKKKK